MRITTLKGEFGPVFFYLENLRVSYLSDEGCDAYIRSACRSYFQLMQARVPLGEGTLCDLDAFLTSEPDDVDQLFHFLWLVNAYARYECFVNQNFRKAQELILFITPLSSRLFKGNFQQFDSESKCFMLLLALNTARVSGYSGQFSLCERQLSELYSFCTDPEMDTFKSFPLIVNHEFKLQRQNLLLHLTADNLAFFKLKINKAMQTLQKLSQSPEKPYLPRDYE